MPHVGLLKSRLFTAVIEFIQAAFALYNLPLTALLGMVMFYWLLVMVGALDFDLDLFDGGADADLGAHPAGGSLGGAMLSAGRLFGFSKVPIAIWGSFFSLFLWMLAMI